MAIRNFTALRRSALAAAPLALALTLAACGDDDNNNAPPVTVPTPTPTVTPSPSPSPTATPTPTSRDVTACLQQMIPGTTFTPATLVLPDTLKLNLTQPAGFPNGRRLNDPVIDVTLGVLLLRLTQHSPAALVGLNPGDDNTLLSTFPFLGLANGGQPGPGTATTFSFRTEPASQYVRVDRMGQPAVATALIPSSRKEAYNDANPSDDVAQAFVPDIAGMLTTIHNALADDLVRAGLTPCST